MRRAVTGFETGTLSIEDHGAAPALRRGEVLVRISASYVAPFVPFVCDPQTAYVTPERPFAPGMDPVGHVLAVGDGVDRVAVGDAVYGDVLLDDGWDGHSGGSVFAGNFAISETADRLFDRYRHGAFASHILLRDECLTAIGPALDKVSEQVLTRLGWLCTALAGLDRGGFAPGEHVVVLGASGQLGSSAVMMALALGASRVTCVGRSLERMAPLTDLDARVSLAREAPKGADVVISAAEGDCAAMIETAMANLRKGGRCVLLASPAEPPRAGGLVSRGIALVGSFWYDRDAPGRVVEMIASGQLDLSRIRAHAYPLAEVNEALAAAAGLPVFEQNVLVP